MKKECSENELCVKAEAYCSSMERCITEVESKLIQWGATSEIIMKVIKYLLKEKYIDQERYCKAFVRDKYRFNQWGRMKIIQALQIKRIPADIIDKGMEEIDEQEYIEILSTLVEQKRKNVKARTDYERNGKLIRFAIGKGFEMEFVLRCVKRANYDEGYMD